MEKENLEILLEDIRGKFDLVLEGHSVLNKRIDDLDHKLDDRFDLMCCKVQTLNQKIEGGLDGLGKKIDNIATDLSAHRRDTEAHPPLYKVKEGN